MLLCYRKAHLSDETKLVLSISTKICCPNLSACPVQAVLLFSSIECKANIQFSHLPVHEQQRPSITESSTPHSLFSYEKWLNSLISVLRCLLMSQTFNSLYYKSYFVISSELLRYTLLLLLISKWHTELLQPPSCFIFKNSLTVSTLVLI